MEESSHKKKEKETIEDISLGSLLEKTREERHIELDEVVEATRIRRHNLEAIESEEWSKLPPQVFVKGFLRSYAEFLGLDKETVMHHYRKTSSFQKSKPEALKKTRPQTGRQYFIIIISVLALALIVALIYPNGSNISIIDKFFQFMGTQNPVGRNKDIVKKDDRAEKGENKDQVDREMDTLRLENEIVIDDVNKTALESKLLNDTIVLDEPTTPIIKNAEKALSPRFTLTANVKSPTWIAIRIDESSVKEYLFQPGHTPRWTADKGFNVLIGNAGGIEFFLNGKEIDNLGAEGQVVRIKLP